MLRKSLFALLVTTSLFGCKKKGDDVSVAEMKTSNAGMGSAMPAPEAARGMAAGEAAKDEGGHGDATAAPAAPKGTATAGVDKFDGERDRKADDIAVRAQAAPSGVRAGEWDDNANYRDYVRWTPPT